MTMSVASYLRIDKGYPHSAVHLWICIDNHEHYNGILYIFGMVIFLLYSVICFILIDWKL